MAADRLLASLTAAFLLLTAIPSAPALAAPPAALQGVGWTQRLGVQLPLGEKFVDEYGESVRLSRYFTGKKPVILTLAYYECPNLCTLVLNGLSDAVRRLPGRKLGADYELVTLSIDPHEKPRLALMKQRTYLARLGISAGWSAARPAEDLGWHFLTGTEAAIAHVAREAGFGYRYDPASREYSHPSGLIVLSADGRTRQYLTGIQFKPTVLAAALDRAAIGRSGSIVEQVLLFCFHYDPSASPNGALIMNLIRGFALLCALTFFLWLARSIRAGWQT